jgi:FeS assembly protein SufD
LAKELTEKGVILAPIGEAFANHESILQAHSEGVIAPLGKDKLAFLNRVIFNTGFFLYVPRNIRIEKPIRHVFSSDRSFSLFSRSIVILEEGAEATILSEEYSNYATSGPSILSSLIEVYLDANSNFAFSSIQVHASNVVNLVNRQVKCGRDSRVKWAGGYTGGSITRARIETLLEGRGSFARDYEVVYADGTSRSDVTTDMIHIGEDTDGAIESRGVLRDKARSTLKGVIKIEKVARNAHSFVGNHAILLSKEARADAVPALEIVTNEVAAKHSASVAQLDENQIFYLMSRGLSFKDTVWMIITGFLDPVTSQIPLEDAREAFLRIISERYEKAKEVAVPLATATIEAPKGRLVQVAKISDFQAGTIKGIEVEGKKILVSNIGGGFYAVGGVCTHEYAELERGFIQGEHVTCPLHLSQFDLKTGNAINPPATEPLPVYRVHTMDQKVYVELEPSGYT